MKNLIICVGQCGINIVNDIPDITKMSDWQIVIVNDKFVSFKDYKQNQWNNVYVFCGFGGQKIHRHLDTIIETFRPLTPNLLFFGAIPYDFEGKERRNRSASIVKELRQIADITVIQANQALMEENKLDDINVPLVSAIVAAMQQSNKPLFYSLHAILETTGVPTGLKSKILTEYIAVLVNEARLKTLVNEALGVKAQVQSPEGVREKMHEIWRNHLCGRAKGSNVFEVELPPPDINEINS